MLCWLIRREIKINCDASHPPKQIINSRRSDIFICWLSTIFSACIEKDFISTLQGVYYRFCHMEWLWLHVITLIKWNLQSWWRHFAIFTVREQRRWVWFLGLGFFITWSENGNRIMFRHMKSTIRQIKKSTMVILNLSNTLRLWWWGS